MRGAVLTLLVLAGACGSRTPLFVVDDCAGDTCVELEPECLPGSRPNVVLELVVDESGSMAGDKWNALRESLLVLFEDVAADRDDSLQIGVTTFDDAATNAVPPAPLSRTGQLQALRRAIDKDSPHGGGTSTLHALTTAFGVVNAQRGVGRVVVLLSDGSPNRGDEEKYECVELVRGELERRRTQLFAVGIGPFPTDAPAFYDPAFMGRLAVAGGTRRSPSCVAETSYEPEICHYQVTPGGDANALRVSFGDALDAIRESATTCP